jgi:hypothetical protein
VLLWLDNMAAQLLPPNTAQPTDVTQGRPYPALTLWLSLAWSCISHAPSNKSPFLLVQPNVLRLLQQWSQHPAPLLSTTAAAASGAGAQHSAPDVHVLMDITHLTSSLCVEVLESQWMQRQNVSTNAPAAAPGRSINHNPSHSSSNTASSSSGQVRPEGPSRDQIAAIIEQGVSLQKE